MEISPYQQTRLLDLARRTIRQTLGAAAQTEMVDGFEPECAFKAGCFVTLHSLRDHRLRGCIGHLGATEPLNDCVAEMARCVLQDPRFTSDRVTRRELPELEIELTILWPLEQAASVTDFDLLNDGIVLHCQDGKGCFLPQVARETGWDKPTLLSRLCTEKMGLPANAWRDPQARLMRFKTLIVGPEPFEQS